VGLRGSQGDLEDDKNSSSRRDSKLGPSVSLPSHYTDYVIPARPF